MLQDLRSYSGQRDYFFYPLNPPYQGTYGANRVSLMLVNVPKPKDLFL